MLSKEQSDHDMRSLSSNMQRRYTSLDSNFRNGRKIILTVSAVTIFKRTARDGNLSSRKSGSINRKPTAYPYILSFVRNLTFHRMNGSYKFEYGLDDKRNQ